MATILPKEELRETTAVLTEYAKRIGDLYKNKVSAYPEFSKSIQTKVVINSKTIEIEMSLLDYWYWIENGRGPGKFPPVDIITNWVERNIPQPNPIPTPSGSVIPTPNQLSFLVGRKIATSGVKGKHYLSETLEEVEKSFVSDITEALTKDIRNYLTI